MNDQVGAEADIRTARATQNKAIADGDVDVAASIWTEDVTMRRGLGQAVIGRAGYREMLLSSSSGQNPVVYQRVAVSVNVSDRWPLAYEEGRWAGHAGDADGQAVIAGRYAAQWVQRDGRWLIRSEVFVALTCEGEGCLFEAAP
jgi:ketosteroid isomerase-like protein